MINFSGKLVLPGLSVAEKKGGSGFAARKTPLVFMALPASFPYRLHQRLA